MRKNNRKSGRRVISVVLTLISFVLLMSPVLAADNTAPDSWLAGIDDNVPISQVNTPGTHNSAAFNVTNLTAGFSKCQNKNPEKQFNCGVRYFDFRFTYANKNGSNDKERLTLCHAIADCFKEGKNAQLFTNSKDILRYDDVIATCREILEKHPTEYIIFSHNYDVGSEDVYGKEFVNDLLVKFDRELAESDPEHFMYLSADSSIPTVGEARGKVILILHSWDGLLTNEALVTDGIGDGVKVKINLLHSIGFGNAEAINTEDNTAESLRVVHLSTYKGFIPMNPRLCSYIINNWFLGKSPFKKLFGKEMPVLKQGTHYGWVLFDYVDSAVCAKIIGVNEQILKK